MVASRDDTTSNSSTTLRFYPERYYCASPTYNTWVKLTAAAVRGLRPAPQQQQQQQQQLVSAADEKTATTTTMTRRDGVGAAAVHRVFFHLNHPIRFVRVVGTVVAIEYVGPRFVLLTLDDGSDATLHVRISRSLGDSTSVSNVTVGRGGSGSLDDVLRVDGCIVDVGTALKAKCTLSTFRGTVQADLQRCWALLSPPDAEADAWLDTAAFMRTVLARPWVLAEHDMARLDARLAAEATSAEQTRADAARARRRRAEKRAAYASWLERRRKKEAALMDRGALV